LGSFSKVLISKAAFDILRSLWKETESEYEGLRDWAFIFLGVLEAKIIAPEYQEGMQGEAKWKCFHSVFRALDQ